jgi:hypothetical protein
MLAPVPRHDWRAIVSVKLVMANSTHQSFQWDPSKLHFEFDLPDKEVRFKELVVYISHQCLDDPTFSRTKLYKILFYSDFEAYGRHGTPITGMSYKKFPFGPGPASYERLQNEMVIGNLIRIVSMPVYDHDRQRVLPLQEPNFNLFSGREVSIVEHWIRFFWKKSARWVSKYSHGKAWKISKLGDRIPYDAVFISNDPVTLYEVERVRELAQRLKWQI